MARVYQHHFARALRYARLALGRSQESLDSVSGRTYVSMLERGLKQPTIGKVAELASALDVHPLTLLALSFTHRSGTEEATRLLLRVKGELHQLAEAHGHVNTNREKRGG